MINNTLTIHTIYIIFTHPIDMLSEAPDNPAILMRGVPQGKQLLSFLRRFAAGPGSSTLCLVSSEMTIRCFYDNFYNSFSWATALTLLDLDQVTT